MKKIFILLILFTVGFGQISSARQGAGLNIGDQGTGIFYHRNIKNYEVSKIGATIRWFDIRPAREVPVYDPYTGHYTNNNTVSLGLFPLFGTFNYYPFEGKIANNFSPFLTAKLGPILVLDADETESFTKRWTKADVSFTYGGNIGVGIEFRQPGNYHYSLELTYDIIPLSKNIDSYDNINGTVLSFSIHRK